MPTRVFVKNHINLPTMAESETKVEFKSIKKRRPVRKREHSNSEDENNDGEKPADDEFNKEKFEETREMQKMRKKSAGTNVVSLALGKKISKVEEVIVNDPFKMNMGGLIHMKDVKGYKVVEDNYSVGTQFSKETHIRDEDDEMRKYIETEMEKMKGVSEEDDDNDGPAYLTPEDAALMALPEHLRKSTFKKDQQMLSAQMLTGIPEVDLGIEAKIKNIERTEQAKAKLLRESGVDKNAPSEFVPTNFAANFVQHDRYRIEEPTEIGREKDKRTAAARGEPINRPNTVNIDTAEDHGGGDRLKGKASDDYHLEKFKQASRGRKK